MIAFGEDKPVTSWAKDPRCVVKYSTLASRIFLGWDLERALTTPRASRNDQPTCSVEGCDRKPTRRGWCNLHYSRWLQTGDPLKTSIPPEGHSFVNRSGYREIVVDGRFMKEHRHVVEQHIGRKLLRTEQVHHINGNRLDNRIENLEVVDTKTHGERHSVFPKLKICENCGDAYVPEPSSRRRQKYCSHACYSAAAKGRAGKSGKLTEADIVEIRKRWRAGEMQSKLAEEFGVSRPVLCRVCKGSAYAWVRGEHDGSENG